MLTVNTVSNKSLNYDVVVIGAGIAGIMLTKKLAQLGFKICLIEKADTLASGPSTRNEGWLHRGTYHALSIPDRSTAIQVAKRNIYGYEQISRYAPEAIDDIGLPSYAVMRNPEGIREALSRWDEAGVYYRHLTRSQIGAKVPELKMSNSTEVFEVKDVGINTRILYRRLVSDAKRAGATIYKNSCIMFGNEDACTLCVEGQSPIPLQARLFVHTVGYGLKRCFENHFGIPIQGRYWKSHLLVTHRLSEHSIFSVEPEEAALMNHQNYSIVGLNEDAFLCSEPNYEVVSSKVDIILESLHRLFASFVTPEYYPVACIKADVVVENSLARSLNVNIMEPRAGHICALPGKMTEAPYLTDALTQIVYEKLDDEEIAERPLDIWRKS